MSEGWTRTITDVQHQSPEGTIENSPPIHQWVVVRKRNESRQGRQNPGSSSNVFFRPFGAWQILRHVNPAINRWAIFGCPCGTKTNGDVEE